MAKKILFLAANLLSGGAERQIVTVARLLKRRGHDVSFYCYGKGDFYGHLLQEEIIPVKWEYSFDNPLKRMWKVRRYIRSGGFDAVISFLPAENYLNDISAICGHKWKVITGLRFCPTKAPGTPKDRFYAWMLRYSDAIVSNSHLAMETWCGFYPSHREKFHVIYNNVQIGDVQTSYVPKRDGKLHIVVAASFQELKNPLGLLASLDLMSEKERECVVIDWYGANVGPVFQQTANAISDKGYCDVFRLHEPVEDIHEKMNQADAVMLLSHREGLPNAICEAMKLGKPVIMSRVSDHNVLIDERNGFLCDSHDSTSIKEAIVDLAGCTVEQLLSMGVASKEKADRLFSDEVITNNWETIIL